MITALIGIDAAGKSTQIKRLARHYRELGHSVAIVNLKSKPTVRNLLRVGRLLGASESDPLAGLDPNYSAIAYDCDFFNHYCRNILPKLASKTDFVFSDRYTLCYEAYAFAVGASSSFARKFLHKLIRPPDLQFMLDIDCDTVLERIRYRTGVRSIDETPQILKRLIKFYRNASTEVPGIVRIDASKEINTVTEELIRYIDEWKDSQ